MDPVLQIPAPVNHAKPDGVSMSPPLPRLARITTQVHRNAVVAVAVAAVSGPFSKSNPSLRKLVETPKAKAPRSGNRRSPTRHGLFSDRLLERIATPIMTSRVPRRFWSGQLSPRRSTAKREAKTGEELTIGTARITPTRSIPT